MIEPGYALAALAIGALVTYGWRALGVVVAGRIDPEGRVIAWVACVAYALLAAVIARMIVLPLGVLAETPLWARLGATAAGVAVWYLAGRRVLAGVAAGIAVMAVLVALTGAAG